MTSQEAFNELISKPLGAEVKSARTMSDGKLFKQTFTLGQHPQCKGDLILVETRSNWPRRIELFNFVISKSEFGAYKPAPETMAAA